MLRNRLMAAAVVVTGSTFLPLASASAALITWQAKQQETGAASDILTTGTFVDSATAAASTVTVGGVTFNTNTDITGRVAHFANGSNITISGVTSHGFTGSAPVGWAPGYVTLVYGLIWGSSSPTIHLGGLTIGQSYAVQIFQGIWNANFPTSFSDGTNVSAALNNGFGGGADHVIGTFTADATSESIFMASITDVPVVNSIELRMTTESSPVPEPASLTLALTGLAGVAAARRRKRG